MPLPGFGPASVDVGFGGAYYAYVDATPLGVPLDPAHHDALIDLGMRIKRAVNDVFTITHPPEDPGGDPDLGFLYGTILVERLAAGAHSRNVCVFANGELDRSPTGTGVSGRAAVHHARGELALRQPIEIESILGTSFTVEVVDTVRVGELDAVIPEVTGSAYLTGRHEFFVDPDDPLRDGFLFRK